MIEAQFSRTLTESHYTTVAVKAATPYVTAKADYSQESSKFNSETQKTVTVSSRYLFPQGRIDFSPPGSGFQDDVQLSPEFKEAVEGALAKPSRAEQREAIHAVLDEFGHVFRTKVQMGGTLSAHTTATYNRSEDDDKVKRNIKVGVEGALQKWGASGSTGHGNTQSTVKTEDGRTLDVKFIVTGGDYSLIQKTDDWIASTRKSGLWRVIEVADAIPVIDMLPLPIRSTAKMLMTPLIGRWVPAQRAPNTDRFPVGIYAPKDPVPAGWFWLGYTATSDRALIVKPARPEEPGHNVAVVKGHRGPGFSNQPFPALPHYRFLSSYFGAFSPDSYPGSALGALRPGLFVEGRWEMKGHDVDTMVYVTRPISGQALEDECFDLQPVIQVKLPGGNVANPPRPRICVRKDVIVFDEEEA
ncbi:erylysin B [Trametes punicea]|nr:erylysin B [Trametes punicea]